MSKQFELNTVTFAIALTPENAGKIDAINKIMLGDAYTTTAPTAEPEAKAETKSTPAKTTSKKAEPKAEETSGVTFADFKKAVSAAKKEHGQEFVVEVLEANGAKSSGTLATKVSAISPDDHEAVMEALAAGPAEAEDEDLPEDEDDGFDDEDEAGEQIDPEAVKTALRAKAKEDRDEAKRIMSDNGAATLSKVADLSQDKLAAIMEELA